MAKKSEEKKYIKNVLVKGKVKYVDMTEKEIEALLKASEEAAEQEG